MLQIGLEDIANIKGECSTRAWRALAARSGGILLAQSLKAVP
ncbi:hypothetical protein [Bradyrhizobium canariense]|nr:hypothetical protein [Bradyrhizobium canariense]